MSELMANRLRRAIRESGLSANALSRATKVPTPTITRFLQGFDMRMSRAEKLAAHLGLELRPKKKR